jgi:hypothetical protein
VTDKQVSIRDGRACALGSSGDVTCCGHAVPPLPPSASERSGPGRADVRDLEIATPDGARWRLEQLALDTLPTRSIDVTRLLHDH